MYGETFSFDEQDTALADVKEVRRWMNWVKTQVRVGIELEKAGRILGYENGHRRVSLFERELEPTGTFDKLSKYNIMSLVFDGSITGAALGRNGTGNEILVTGAIEDFSTAHRKMKALHELFARYGLKVDESCGMHYHLVAAQDDYMPQVVLKNFYQLTRRYYAALVYLTGTSGASNRIVRHHAGLRTHFFKATHLSVSPLGQTMLTVKRRLAQLNSRYNAFNMGEEDSDDPHHDLTRFGPADRVERFHVELRFPDASDSPAQIVAQMFLFRGLLMKAVELSQYGVMKVDSSGQWQKNKKAVELLQKELNEEDVPMTFDEAVQFAKNDARNLLLSIRGHLKNIDGQSYNVLVDMVEKPVWVRRRAHRSWKVIEASLMPRERILESAEKDLLRIISLNQLTGIKNIGHWKHAASTALGITEKDTVAAFRRLEAEVKLAFDREMGTFVVVW